MRGLNASSHWTHLIPGLIVGGVGVGLVNPPLASTAVGVVEPQRAGMASGINSTFRQVGIATGIALLGTLFANRVLHSVLSQTSGVKALSGQGHQLATAVQSGSVGQVLHKAPAGLRGQIEHVTTTAFTSGLNLILLVGAGIAGVCRRSIAFLTIRQKDFAHQGGAH